MTSKKCTKCGAVKPVNQFGKNKRRKSGFDGICKACTRARYKAWEQKKLPELTAYRRQYYSRNNDKILAQRKAQWQSMTPAERKARNLTKYNLTLERFQVMLEEQGGCCDMCREPLTTPFVDHDHKTGRVRSLLCNSCNTAIGYLNDDPVRALQAAAYLQKHQSNHHE